ncbi:MAG: ATP-grasp domain-containing protein [Clostridia bacterium]|nr:ATP-grasp domain-containing protein [Clostridia bacterium]
MQGWLIYRRPDAERNSRYITFYGEAGERYGLQIELKYFESFAFGTESGQLALFYEGERVKEQPDFVIMRADEPLFSEQLEQMGYRVFNNAYLSRIANDKEKTLRLAAAHGINVPDTCFADHQTAQAAARMLGFPLVIKPPDGHGGQDVCMVQSEAELFALLEQYAHKRFLLQRPVSDLGKDLRVYVVGGRIVAGMLRERKDDFRSNYCLGGGARRYMLSAAEEALVYRVCGLFQVDYAGFDFMFHEGNMILNEIEDVVGARMLYTLTDIDVVDVYLRHIKACITEG